jgi:hypothetical protein
MTSFARAKPAEKRGRKTTGLAFILYLKIAGLPKENSHGNPAILCPTIYFLLPQKGGGSVCDASQRKEN